MTQQGQGDVVAPAVMDNSCPFCGSDPYHRTDLGEPVAVTCCETACALWDSRDEDTVEIDRADLIAISNRLRESRCLETENDRLRTLLSSSRGEQGWRTIDSAPKDGTQILAWWDGKPIITYWAKRYHFEGWQAPSMMTVNAADKSAWNPTHWMPLPSAPGSVPTSAVEQLPDEPKRKWLDRTEFKFGECEECGQRRNLGRAEYGAFICGSCADEQYAAEILDYARELRNLLQSPPQPTSLAGQVPDEPTDEMIHAGRCAISMFNPDDDYEQAKACWRAMASVAPQTPFETLIIDAFNRSISWWRENTDDSGAQPSYNLQHKAAYDYADKTLSVAPQPTAGGDA